MSEAQTDLIQDIHDRLEAIGEQTSEERIRGIVETYLVGLTDADPLVRKMRFGSADAALSGTKFARFNLTPADVEFLHDVQTARQAAGMGKGPSAELANAFRAISDAQYLSDDEVRRIDGQAIDGMFPRISKRQVKAYEAAVRAMDTAESGYGSQLVGAQYVGDLWEAARAESRIFGLLNTFEMTSPTAYLPVEVDIPELLYVSESTASNSANYTSVKTGSNRVTVSATKFVIHQMWSGEMEEDSIIPFVPFLRRQAGLALAHYSDSLVLNGDTTNAATGNINLDDADPADTKHYLAFDGIRHAAIVDNTANKSDASGALAIDDFRALKALMVDTTYLHDWGHPTNSEDLVFIADPFTADYVSLLDEVQQAKYMLAANANLLNGEVARIIGHPVVSSMAMSKTEADGKVSTTGGNNTKGQLTAFNRRAFVPGWRRRVKIETERIPATDQTRIVYSLRMGFGRFSPTGAASGIEGTATLYNITV